MRQYEGYLGMELRINSFYQRESQPEVEEARTSGEDTWVGAYLAEGHETKAAIEKKYPSIDVNVQVQKIVTGRLALPDPQNVCCSPALY